MMKKEPKPFATQMVASYNPMKFDNQQEYVYLSVRKGFTAWQQGRQLIHNISDLLRLEPGTFTDGRYLKFVFLGVY